jgi:hypothetical protein
MRLAIIFAGAIVLASAAAAGARHYGYYYDGCEPTRDNRTRVGERIRVILNPPNLHSYQLCLQRHASTHCYGGSGEPWSKFVDDSMKGFR